MTEAEVDRLFRIWAYSPATPCACPDHNEKRKNVCSREEAWRAYCAARINAMELREKSKNLIWKQYLTRSLPSMMIK